MAGAGVVDITRADGLAIKPERYAGGAGDGIVGSVETEPATEIVAKPKPKLPARLQPIEHGIACDTTVSAQVSLKIFV